MTATDGSFNETVEDVRRPRHLDSPTAATCLRARRGRGGNVGPVTAAFFCSADYGAAHRDRHRRDRWPAQATVTTGSFSTTAKRR
jgi:hypothetical protein